MKVANQRPMFENNQVELTGEIVADFMYSHEVYGEKFYKTFLEVTRTSKNIDTIPVVISERLIDIVADWKGKYLRVIGQYRSFNRRNDEKVHVELYVFARDVEEISEMDIYHTNNIVLDGYICKEVIYRETPLGREIADLLVAVNRSFGKSDYIPIICWGRNAKFASTFEVGTHVQIWGRIQSRQYVKKVSDTEIEERVAYEVSVSRIEKW